MKLRFFDAHSHIQDAKFDTDRETVLVRMKEAGMGALVVGTDRDMSRQAVSLARRSDILWAVVGQHPTDKQEEFSEAFYEELIKEAAGRVVAIGECGLDFFRGEKNKEEYERQVHVFRRQIRLAAHVDLPLMIHCRPSAGTADAYEECISILKDEKTRRGDQVRGNVHFFVGDYDVGKQFFDLGFSVSFTGVVSFTHDYDEVVRRAPLERILSETDCPYVAPVPFRGKRNEPVYVAEVVKAIARIRGESEERVGEAMVANAARVFNIPLLYTK